MSRTIIITGSAGFIGANFTKYWAKKYPTDYIIGIDSRTYAASDEAIKELRHLNNYQWINADINHREHIHKIFQIYKPDHVFHFAAESHVCRSIEGPEKFFRTNVMGTVNLLDAFVSIKPTKGQTFYYVSTDEIFGEASESNHFNELSRLSPRSPYAASKAAGNLALDAYRHTYGIKTLSSSCTNNFGPFQHEEKLLPKTWLSCLRNKPMTIYGSGEHVRDWLPVEFHCSAIETIFLEGRPGINYLIGSGHLRTNNKIIEEALVALCADGVMRELSLEHTNDRPSDDKMYAVHTAELENLGWKKPTEQDIDDALKNTAKWYKDTYAT